MQHNVIVLDLHEAFQVPEEMTKIVDIFRSKRYFTI